MLHRPSEGIPKTGKRLVFLFGNVPEDVDEVAHVVGKQAGRAGETLDKVQNRQRPRGR